MVPEVVKILVSSKPSPREGFVRVMERTGACQYDGMRNEK